jgi:hypothetical protein
MGLRKAMQLLVISCPSSNPFVMVHCRDYASEQDFEPHRLYGRFFSSNVVTFSLKNLGDLPFDQVILRLSLVSHILAQSSKI